MNEDDDDKAKILAKFTHSSEEPNLSINPMTTFDNPTYGSAPSGPPVDDVEVEKEDLSMIGKPISCEDDIEL